MSNLPKDFIKRIVRINLTIITKTEEVMQYRDEMAEDMCTNDLEKNICITVLYRQGTIESDEQTRYISRRDTIAKSCDRN